MIYSSCPDIGNEPPPNSKEGWFPDGNRFTKRKRLVECAVTFQTQVREAKRLPTRISVQMVEVIPLVET